MAWYDDPNNTQGPFTPEGSGDPPVAAPLYGGQPQPPPVSPQMPAGPPRIPGGPTPPGVHGDLPTSGGSNNNRVLLILAGVAVAAIITIVGGIGAFMLLGGPEELSMRNYADKMCNEAIKSNVKEIESVVDSRRYGKRIYGRDIDNEDEAKEAIDLVAQNLDGIERLTSDLQSFNGSHILRGRDGEELQEELTDYVDSVNEDLDKARKTLGEADPFDEEDVLDDIDDALAEIDDPSIYRDDRDPGYDLNVALEDADENCAIFYGR